MITSTADNSRLQMPVLQHVFVSRESQRRIAIGVTILAESGAERAMRCGGAPALGARVSLF